jgi:nucleoside-diphosphate-sugar epimerase
VKVVVTGASGFIGKPIVNKLLMMGCEVLAIGREMPAQQKLNSLHWLKANFSSPKTYQTEINAFKPEALIHLAWQDIPDYSLEKSILNLNQSLSFISFITKIKSCKKILISGSCWEYGKMYGECLNTDIVNPMNFFSISKHSLHLLTEIIAKQKSIKLGWFRLFFVYGPEQRSGSLIPSILNNLKKGQLPNIRTPINANDFVYVDDVANAFAKAVSTNFPSGIYNLGSGRSTTVLEVCRIAEKIVLGAESLTAQLESKTESSRCEVNFWADVKSSKEILDWQPTTSLKEGIQQTQQWINSQ